MLFFTSDSHLGHKNILHLDGRPYASLEEMEHAFIDQWNETVTSQDTVYHLGDFFWKLNVAERVLPQLNGRIVCVKGNHDNSWWGKVTSSNVTFAPDSIYVINEPGITSTVLCHYPMRSWPGSARGAWHLYGHTHRALTTYGKSLCVCWNVRNYTLVSLDTVREEINAQPETEDIHGKPI